MSIKINQRHSSSRTDPGLPVVVRAAAEADAEALRRLAEIDSAPLPGGRVIVAEVGGEIRAAVSVDDGRAISNPFERSAEVAALAEMRAAQLRGATRRRARLAARTSRRAPGLVRHAT
ncbi:MAG TPA: hypothetical protein VK919_10475 [Solirubrobacterales bacterium]|nr:hypothetical protein [Solirubrobacterales bacterium]